MATERPPEVPITTVTRVFLGQALSLATLAPVIVHIRAVLSDPTNLVELDSRELVSVTEGASMLLSREMDRAHRAGVRFRMAA